MLFHRKIWRSRTFKKEELSVFRDFYKTYEYDIIIYDEEVLLIDLKHNLETKVFSHEDFKQYIIDTYECYNSNADIVDDIKVIEERRQAIKVLKGEV